MQNARRLPVALAVVAALVLAIPAVASAHVVISPGTAPKGGTDVELSLRAPDESDTASTVGLDVQLPTDHPLLGVLVKPIPGWTAKVTTKKLAKPVKTDDGEITEAVSEINWTGGSVPPGEYQDFTITVGQLPSDADQLEFKAIQTYSDKSVVSWIEDTPANGEEPEHPAPILKLTGSGSDTGSDAGSSATSAPAAGSGPGSGSSGVTVAVARKSDVDSAKTFGIVGIVLGVVGIAIGAAALASARKRRAA